MTVIEGTQAVVFIWGYRGFAEEPNRKIFPNLEYAWDLASCDPCSTPPLNRKELEEAGVFWLEGGGRKQVFVTRLHLRYGPDNFPEDLRFEETANNQFFQGRYIIRHSFKGNLDCEAATQYLRKQFENAAKRRSENSS